MKQARSNLDFLTALAMSGSSVRLSHSKRGGYVMTVTKDGCTTRMQSSISIGHVIARAARGKHIRMACPRILRELCKNEFRHVDHFLTSVSGVDVKEVDGNVAVNIHTYGHITRESRSVPSGFIQTGVGKKFAPAFRDARKSDPVHTLRESEIRRILDRLTDNY